MPSRPISPPPQPPPPPHHLNPTTITTASVAAFSFLILLTVCFRKLTRKRTVPTDSKPPHRFPYSVLRRATHKFSPSRRLGQGGFGSVYSGTLALASIVNHEIAVKVMDAGSLQGEREFQNELFFAGKIESSFVASVIGFSSDRKRRRMLLVYELMSNGSLQDCLLHKKCPELKEWKNRFGIVSDIAKGLEYLHHYCDPPVIHGDIKPSNVLLDQNFRARIGDFGLARLKSEDHCEINMIAGQFDGKKQREGYVEDNGSTVETESVTTIGFDDFNVGTNQSPESCAMVAVAETSPEMGTDVELAVSPRIALAAESVSERVEKASEFDKSSLGSGVELVKGNSNGGAKKSFKRLKSLSGKDWWWKQDNNNGGESGVVKDYVMEWIGNEIKKERPKSEWVGASSSTSTGATKPDKKKSRKRLDWWMTLDEEKNKNAKKDKRRPAREWWKEEYCEELAKKKKKKKKGNEDSEHSENWWPMDEDLYHEKRKKRSRSRSGKNSVDWWLDGLSGELWRARRNSHDSVSGEIPKSGGISSTPSMRGTVCYVAPEYGGGGELSEKCDVYSFGVLLLVVISGRRPLQVTGSPMSEFQRANLLSWARHLARAGKLLELVDQSVQSVNQEQALLCITLALLCLQKSPAKRPSMKEIVGMLSGELEAPRLPIEFSPSPPSRIPFKSHRKAR